MFHTSVSQSGMPTKALICYCPHEPNETISNVDAMTEKGYSGKMALEETGTNIIKHYVTYLSAHISIL